MYTKTLRNPSFFIFFMNISHHPHREGCALKISQVKKHAPTLNFVYCFTEFIGTGGGGGCFYMYFKIMLKVLKYTCRLRRYYYTHDQLNTRNFNIIFVNFFEGGGRKI